MKYLKKFENHAAYAAAKSGLILPNVSLCVQENEVHYNPIDPYGGHDYVEIGGLKWATMNIGANSVTDGGLYFQWGDTQGYTSAQVGSGEGKKYFGWADYKYGNGTSNPRETDMTKYNSSDGKTVLDAEDDAATANWGGNWRMPTASEFQALGEAVNSAWTSNYNNSGVGGMIFTDKIDNSKILFFPFMGQCSDGETIDVTNYVYCWSSSLCSSYLITSYEMIARNGLINWNSSFTRKLGNAIRPVAD